MSDLHLWFAVGISEFPNFQISQDVQRKPREPNPHWLLPDLEQTLSVAVDKRVIDPPMSRQKAITMIAMSYSRYGEGSAPFHD